MENTKEENTIVFCELSIFGEFITLFEGSLTFCDLLIVVGAIFFRILWGLYDCLSCVFFNGLDDS